MIAGSIATSRLKKIIIAIIEPKTTADALLTESPANSRLNRTTFERLRTTEIKFAHATANAFTFTPPAVD